MNFVRDLWEIVLDVIGFFQIATVIDSFEAGVLLRFGKFKRTLEPGLRWHLPFGIDEIITMNVVPGVMELDEQVCTTADEYKVAVSGVLKWSIFDIRRCTLDVEDAEDSLSDIALGFIQESIERTDWDDIRTKDFRSALKRDIQKQARKWGITVHSVKFADLAETKVFRLIS